MESSEENSKSAVKIITENVCIERSENCENNKYWAT